MATLNKMQDILFSSNNLSVLRGEEILFEEVAINSADARFDFSVNGTRCPYIDINLQGVGGEINFSYGNVGTVCQIGTKEENFNFIISKVEYSFSVRNMVEINIQGTAYADPLEGDVLVNDLVDPPETIVEDDIQKQDIEIRNRFIYMDFED